MTSQTYVVSVFTASRSPKNGGNLCPVVVDATGMSNASMQKIARNYGHESSFVINAPFGSGYDWQLRFWVPEHEMEMCGHATVGTTWVLSKLRLINATHSGFEIKFSTKSGIVRARIHQTESQDPVVEISQPQGWVVPITDPDLRQDILELLRITPEQLDSQYPIQNACTSRVKTMIPLKDAVSLNALQPDFSGMKDLCEKLDSTGLYPYTITSSTEGSAVQIEARQFPKAVGYPEDAATGVAAAALSYALLENKVFEGREEKNVVIQQGIAMGCPSEIKVRIEEDSTKGSWIGGTVRWVDDSSERTGL